MRKNFLRAFMVVATTILTSACAKTVPVINGLALQAKCQPGVDFETRWNRTEREWCATLNERIKEAREKARLAP